MIPIIREQALVLLKKYNPDPQDINHYIESEAVMKELAIKIGEEPEYYAMLGLLHDIDWGITKNNIKEHLTKAPGILKEAGFDQYFIDIIISHGFGFDCAGLKEKKRTEKIQFALAASETITGLIHAYALMRGTLKGMEVKGLKKKFKDKRFAAGVERQIILEIENIMPLDEFFQLSIDAITKIADQVGLEAK